MLDMQVIVRLQDRGALRLDHLHDHALCGPKGEGDLPITHIMPLSATCCRYRQAPLKLDSPSADDGYRPLFLTGGEQLGRSATVRSGKCSGGQGWVPDEGLPGLDGSAAYSRSQ
jgi:hypothetical protein